MARRRRRPTRREREHAAAHTDPDVGHGDILDDPLVPKDEAAFLTTPEDLRSLLEHIREVGTFAFDTEFIGEESYHPRICLLQVATPDRIALIDPFSVGPLDDLWRLVADPSVGTIVHAGTQDLEPVVRYLDVPPAAIFDTQIVAAFTGHPYPLSLANLVEAVTGQVLRGRHTLTQWDARPLSASQRHYAADDVRYLLLVQHWLESEGHAAWAAEACGELCRIETYRDNDETRFRRVRRSKSLKPSQLAILRSLAALRDSLAQTRDLPPRTVLTDEVLVALSRHPVETPEALASVKGFPRPMAQSHGEAFCDAIASGRRVEPPDRPRPVEIHETPLERLRIDGLWGIVTAWCIGRGVAPGIVATRLEVARWYRARTGKGAGSTPNSSGRLDEGWRRELLGEPLEAFLSGDAGVTFAWRDGRLRSERTSAS